MALGHSITRPTDGISPLLSIGSRKVQFSNGAAYPYARFFHEVDLDLLNNIIKVNVEAVTMVTKVVLNGKLRKKRGAILNIGSGSASVSPCFPLYAVYAATKA
ncbi:hypothetical protein AMTR_s00049p00175130 [Amborella trichopoda]|uniref:Uncharacterized protein n=1 Tax=Amborella trichopoda TaxID=13333 RepID=W1PZX0_AMBTC|nr:hypothetical protein AMTR_s00049p00175130 [Amborella trichopoda]